MNGQTVGGLTCTKCKYMHSPLDDVLQTCMVYLSFNIIVNDIERSDSRKVGLSTS